MSRMAFNVMLGLRRYAPFSQTSAGHHRSKQKLVLHAQDGFFRTMSLLTKASFRRRGIARKKRPTFVERFCLVVIRLGFEPKTHSLEGCCSIQLSYRTDPYLLLISRMRSKVAAKIMIIFVFASRKWNVFGYSVGSLRWRAVVNG